MDYKSIFTRFLTSAKWQTSKSWFGGFAWFVCYLTCLCDVVNWESFINCLPSWDIFVLISMLPTHSVTSGICTFAMHLPHNQPPRIHAFDMLNQSRSWKGKLPDVDRSLSFEMSCFFISSWIRVYLFGIINFHQKFLQNINVLRSDCHRLIREFYKYLQQLRNIWLFE